jgi:hypothetical protein
VTAIEVVLALLVAFDANDIERARELVSPDFAATPHTSGQPIGREEYLAAHIELATAFGWLQRDVLDLRDEPPDGVMAQIQVVAMNDRPIRLPTLGIDLETPTGRELRTVPHVDHFHVREGRVVGYRSEQPPGSGLKGLLDQIREETYQ